MQPAWNWSAPEGRFSTVIGGGPVIDNAGNFYVITHEGVHKIGPQGQRVWFHQVPVHMNNQVTLVGDTALGTRDGDGTAFALDVNTGATIWETKLAKDAGLDSGYPSAHNGVFVVGAEAGHHPSQDGGNNKVFGLDAATGNKLWQFAVEAPVWNFAPLFPNDNSTVFQDFVGNVYKLNLQTGQLLWKTMAVNDQKSFSDGGAMLGSDFVYTCSNVGSSGGNEGTSGALRAYGLMDGTMAWEQILPQPCNSYPAVGKLGSSNELSVVVTPGAFTGTLSIHGSVMAFDAKTGHLQWQYQCPVWHGIMAKSDLTGVPCIPAHWSAPFITSDGDVLAVRIDGLLYKVRDTLQGQREQSEHAAPSDINFATTPGVQAETYDLDRSSLHGAIAFAPKTMAVATCDSLFVWRY